MKVTLFGLILLSTLTLAFAGAGNPNTETKSNQATGQSGADITDPASVSAPTQSGVRATIMSRAEADSLRAQEGSLLAQSDVANIKVGYIGSDELIYVLVVVLLVVLIIAVI